MCGTIIETVYMLPGYTLLVSLFMTERFSKPIKQKEYGKQFYRPFIMHQYFLILPSQHVNKAWLLSAEKPTGSINLFPGEKAGKWCDGWKAEIKRGRTHISVSVSAACPALPHSAGALMGSYLSPPCLCWLRACQSCVSCSNSAAHSLTISCDHYLPARRRLTQPSFV